MVFFTEDGDPMLPITGYYTPRQLEPYLKMIKQGDFAIFSDASDFEKYMQTLFRAFAAKF